MRALSVIGFTEHRFFIGFLRAQNCFPLIADTVRKDFWPLAEEHFFTLGREWGILISKINLFGFYYCPFCQPRDLRGDIATLSAHNGISNQHSTALASWHNALA